MKRENWISFAFIVAGLLLVLAAWLGDEPFTITLATKVVILALAGVGLNLALGHGGLVSLGHAAFSDWAVMQWAFWPVMRKASNRWSSLAGPLKALNPCR